MFNTLTDILVTFRTLYQSRPLIALEFLNEKFAKPEIQNLITQSNIGNIIDSVGVLNENDFMKFFDSLLEFERIKSDHGLQSKLLTMGMMCNRPGIMYWSWMFLKVRKSEIPENYYNFVQHASNHLNNGVPTAIISDWMLECLEHGKTFSGWFHIVCKHRWDFLIDAAIQWNPGYTELITAFSSSPIIFKKTLDSFLINVAKLHFYTNDLGELVIAKATPENVQIYLDHLFVPQEAAGAEFIPSQLLKSIPPTGFWKGFWKFPPKIQQAFLASKVYSYPKYESSRKTLEEDYQEKLREQQRRQQDIDQLSQSIQTYAKFLNQSTLATDCSGDTGLSETDSCSRYNSKISVGREVNITV